MATDLSAWLDRETALLGAPAVARLQKAKVAVFGLGGVGGFACEALARAGVGRLVILDNDRIDETNLNRQVIALTSTVGKLKTDVMEERLLDINPDIEIEKHAMFYLPENADEIDLSDCDYLVDCIDTVAAKVELAKRGQKYGIPVISSMGTGNKLEPARLEVCDITKTSVCPLARVMRKKLKEAGVDQLKVVYSKEEPVRAEDTGRTPGSVSFVPSAAGLIMAGEVIRDLIK